jgi:hypothetical protein
LIAVLMIIVGLHLGLLAWHTHRDRQVLNARGVHGVATVDDLGGPNHGITENYDPWTLDVSYTVAGRRYSNLLLNHPSQLTPARGDVVDIVFDPADPQRAAIVGDTALGASLLCAWCWSAFAGIATAATVVALLGALGKDRRWTGRWLVGLLCAASLLAFAAFAGLSDNGLRFPRHSAGGGNASFVAGSPPGSAISRWTPSKV